MSDLPKHVAIIMDGNGRWAKARALSRTQGHKAGVQAVYAVVEMCLEQEIPVLSLFGFSRENSGRPQFEVQALMNLFIDTLKTYIDQLHEQNIRIRFIGDRQFFSKRLQTAMMDAELLTQHNQRLQLILALNYSGQWDVMQAMQHLAQQVQLRYLAPEQIDASMISQSLMLNDVPDPDLFIRTSGEQRISNFYLWNLAYTELYFTEVYWPDFKKDAFSVALQAYRQRNRRFGLIPQSPTRVAYG